MSIADRIDSAVGEWKGHWPQVGTVLVSMVGEDLFGGWLEEDHREPLETDQLLTTGYSLELASYRATTLALLIRREEVRGPDGLWPIWALGRLGVTTFIGVNAATALHQEWKPADVLLVDDHLMWAGRNPLDGVDLAEVGPTFLDVTRCYDRTLLEAAQKAADTNTRRGVLACKEGFCTETAAESRALRHLGADAVSPSMGAEVLAARHAGMRVLAMSSILRVNEAPHDKESSLEAMLEAANLSTERLQAFLPRLLSHLPGGSFE